MAVLTRSRCIILTLLLSHFVIISIIVISLLVNRIVYKDQYVQDMYTDMRLITLGRPGSFCQSVSISSYTERSNASRYQSLAIFDAYVFFPKHAKDLTTVFRNRTVTGKNLLLGANKDYYSFHWLNGTAVSTHLTTTYNASVIVIKGNKHFDAVRHTEWINEGLCRKTTCLETYTFTDQLNFDLLINDTDDYFIIFAADRSKKDITINYEFRLNQSAYDVNQTWIFPKVSGRSEIHTDNVNDHFILDFSRKANVPDVRDFSNTIVKLECESNLLTYLGVFGLSGLAIIFILVLSACIFIHKRYGDGDELVNTGDFNNIEDRENLIP